MSNAPEQRVSIGFMNGVLTISSTHSSEFGWTIDCYQGEYVVYEWNDGVPPQLYKTFTSLSDAFSATGDLS